MVRELNVKMKKRPRLEELHIHDVLHVGTEEKGDIFHILKLDDTNYLMQREGTDEASEYHKSVLNKNIASFAERYDAVYTITEYDDEDDNDEDEPQGNCE